MSGTGVRGRVGLGVSLSLVLIGCAGTQSITQTAFERAAADAASIMSAAAVTLQFVHETPARLTVEYGAGSFINYDDQVASVPDELPTLQGAPDAATVTTLVTVLEPAVAVVHQPCLLPDCDWQTQIDQLVAAREALLAAIE